MPANPDGLRYLEAATRLVAPLLLVWPLESQAYGGGPLFINFVAYSWLLVIPAIGVEAFVLRKRLALATGRAAAISTLTNIPSALIATAVVLGCGYLLGLLELSATPAAEADLAVFLVLVPCFFLSVWFETLAGAPLLRQFSRREVRAAFFLANQFSYAMLAIVPIARFLKSALYHGRIIW